VSDSGFVMYGGTVRSLPFAEQLRAASLTGCRSLTIMPFDYARMVSGGASARDVLTQAEQAGIAINHFEPFVRWVPNWQPENADAGMLEVIKFDQDDLFRFTEELGVKSFTALATFPSGSLPLNEIIDCFGALCARAARHGVRCDLEFMPFWGITNLQTAWNVVKGAAASNSGLVLDIWHYTRSGSEDALLHSIPGNKITAVQLADGDAVAPSDIGVFQETMTRRLPPGKGGFRIHEIVTILRQIGGLNNVGPEILSTTFDSLPAEDIAAQCKNSVAWALGR
jgi:sugar phosphate isomerase/epimerase